MKDRNIMLEVAELIANNPVSRLLRTSEIRTAGGCFGESGGQRFREHAIRYRLMTGLPSHEYCRYGYYRIFGGFKRYCQKYARSHRQG